MNDQYIKHFGYTNTKVAIAGYFSLSTAKFISSKITELLKPFYPPGIIVPCERVSQVMNDVYEAYRPSTGDIFTRYVIPSDESTNSINEMINQVIQIIVTNIKDNLLTDQRNANLDNWSILYGTFNKYGLRQHAPIKLRERRPPTNLFQMNY